MIKLNENRAALLGLPGTIQAIETLDYLIKSYKEEGKVGPAYCKFDCIASDHSAVQFDRSIVVEALLKQRESLVKYLADLGIDAEGENV